MSTDWRALADFLEGLAQLAEGTGVKITHYDRIQLTLPSGIEVNMAGSINSDGQYDLDIRDNG